MTNLLNLPQIPAGTTISISSNADFNDQFFVTTPNFPSAPLTIIGTLDGSTANVTGISSTVGLVPGQAVTGYGIPPNTVIAPGGVSTNMITLTNSTTIAIVGIQLTLLAPPLDLTGISFSSMLRVNSITSTVIISMTTANGLMVNGNQNGQFGWSVPSAKLPAWPGLSGTGQLPLVLDIQATDITGAIVDLCAENGPIPVTVNLAITR